VKSEGDPDWRQLGNVSEFGADLYQATAPSTVARTSRMAITSLGLGVGGLITCGLTSVIGLILGILSLNKISRSGGTLRGVGYAIAGIAVSAVFSMTLLVQSAIIVPAIGKAKEKAQIVNCVNNLKQLGLAVRMYEADHGVYPGTNWCDQLKSAGLIQGPELKCPGHLAGSCAYAMNIAAAGKQADEIIHPNMVLFFESDLGYNACAGKESMIESPRHGDEYNVAMVDGSVQGHNAWNVSLLQWEP
jgi:prepilin-type processing-associated H-X9-DG protein